MRVIIIASLTLKAKGTPYVVFNGPAFHYTNKTCLKTVGHCGYEWVEKEMGWFAEDMS